MIPRRPWRCRYQTPLLGWGGILSGFLAILLPAFAVGASGSESPPEAPGAPLRMEPALGRFLPGQAVTLGWPAPPEEADEFEVLLEPLLPPGPPLRIASGRWPAPAERRVTLPNLALGPVRLQLRVGREGLGETLWASSSPFLLGFSPLAPPSEVRWRFGEWTLGEEAPPGPAGSLAPGASFRRDFSPFFLAMPSADWRSFSSPAPWPRLALEARPGSPPERLAAPPEMDRLSLLEVLRI